MLDKSNYIHISDKLYLILNEMVNSSTFYLPLSVEGTMPSIQNVSWTDANTIKCYVGVRGVYQQMSVLSSAVQELEVCITSIRFKKICLI